MYKNFKEQLLKTTKNSINLVGLSFVLGKLINNKKLRSFGMTLCNHSI